MRPFRRHSASRATVLVCMLAAACGSEPASSEATILPLRAEPAPAAPAPEPEPIDLLPAFADVLAVSSSTPSLRSGPDLLIDGDLETSWASQRGDSQAFIEVRLPSGSRVSAIALTAGYTKVDGQLDLFTANHRVGSIRVLHDGREVLRTRLDVDDRALQSFAVDAAPPDAGGVWRVELADVLPGSRRNWREVCVSELRFFGRPPQNAPTHEPRLLLGGAAGVSILDIKAARAELASSSDRHVGARQGLEPDPAAWWAHARVALRAYPVRCELPHLRDRLARAIETALRARGEARVAQLVREDLACPGPLRGAELMEVDAVREVAERLLRDARLDESDALDDASALFFEWTEECGRRLGPDTSEAEQLCGWATLAPH